MSAQLQKTLSTLFANVGFTWDGIGGGMVHTGSTFTDEDQADIHIPLGV
jgi:hypothetical protein